jgi:Ca2+-transporting ATPase
MNTDIKKGLTDAQVQMLREKHGKNQTTEKNRSVFLHALKDVVTEPLFILLVFAALIYFLSGEIQEGIIMIASLFFVAGISLYQENRSRNAVETLKKLAAPQATVIRNGQQQIIPYEELVPGDILLLEDGNSIPADGIIRESHDFSVNESILTGESLSVDKNASDTNNLIFQGTLVVGGACVAEVTATADQTALGKIGKTMQSVEESKTPLQLQIKRFVQYMVGFGIIAFITVWTLNYLSTRNLLDSLLSGLTIAMSVLPEEIPVAFSTFMALGAYHLYKKKVIARSPHTVETLGAATVICSDKTGTITENAMQLAVIYDYRKEQTYNYTEGTPPFNEVLEYAMWASEITPFDNMEKAIHAWYEKSSPQDVRQTFHPVREYPLGGKPPIMTHAFQDDKGNSVIACKGSVEGVLQQTSLSAEERSRIQQVAASYAAKGYRILAVAKSVHDIHQLPDSQHALSFELLGLIGFYDPPKENIREVLQDFYRAGIEVKMITGDYAETAMAIAGQIQLHNNSVAVTGNEVMTMDEKSLQQTVKTCNVFARMFPEAKMKVIQALKTNGEVVAMTGDGVNDGPALKAAHIGIAMGLRGSETAKKAASLIIMDDDLGHMVNAVALGRRIYENLKKAIQYIISIHIPIILIVTIPLLLSWTFTDIFTPIHVIFLELIMGPTCSIIFEREPIEADSMQKKPRKMTTTFFSLRELSISIIQGLVITAACLGIGYVYLQKGYDQPHVRTIIYATLLFSNLFLTLANRSFRYSIFTTLRYKNNLLPIVLALSVAVLLASLYVPPVRNLFDFSPISGQEVALSLGIAFAAVMWVEIYKYIKYQISDRK